MNRALIMIPLCLIVASCGGNRTADRARAPDSVDSALRVAVVNGLAGPEGVRYDPELDVYFVSNFNGEPAGDANGFISRVGPDGAMQSRTFMTGTDHAPLHGPRGMWLTGDTLWAVDADGVHRFDRRSGAHIGFVDFSRFAPGFLNDIVRGPDDALYVTDTDRPRIYRLAGDEATIAVEDTALCGPNGITWDAAGARFLLASWNRGPSVHAWRQEAAGIEALGAPGPGGFDGIELIGDLIVVASQSDSSLHAVSAAGERTIHRGIALCDGHQSPATPAPCTQALAAYGRCVITSVPTQEAAMVKLTVRKVGNSLGVTLPAQAAQALHVKEGDQLYLTEAPDGFRLTPYDPEFAKTMEVAEGFMNRYKNALRDLAK